MSVELGRLERVQLREVWTHEATSFTPWLATEDNLRLLGEAIGLDLSVEGVEENVGPFRADIYCKAMDDSSHSVLIENQIERTDHGHLGQLITYAAGLHTATIVWIAQRFTEEHRAALDWLNEVTNEEIRFFGLEIELWRISGSMPAPKFNIVSQPNGFVKRTQAERSRSAAGAIYAEYWQQFNELISARSKTLRPMKVGSDSWMNFSIGRSNFCIGAQVSVQAKKGDVYFHVYNDRDKTYFQALRAHQATIDAAFPTLIWDEKPGRLATQLRLTLPFDPADRTDWPRQHAWVLENLEQFKTVFSPIAMEL